jgi:predicted TIM-barrel fold metal-dependent hydrolase
MPVGARDRLWQVTSPVRELKTLHYSPARETINTPPMHYFKQIYYDSAVFDVTTLRAVVDFAGASHVMYGTDFPPGSADLAANLARIDALSPDQAKAVKGGNAQALFGL